MNDADFFALLGRLLAERQPAALATVVGAKGSAPRRVGARMIVLPDRVHGTVGGGKFESLVADEARGLIARGAREALTKEWPLHEGSPESFGAICGGAVTVLIEPLGLAPKVVCVGAGHCARALAKAALLLGWSVEVLEDRPEEMSPERYPGSLLTLSPDLPTAIDAMSLDGATAIALLNRNYQLDRDCLERLLVRRRSAPPEAFPFYVGMIGSDRKVKRVRDELLPRGIKAEELDLVRAPIGLEIEAETPEEIAVSILAEMIQAWRAGRATAARADR